jgi:transposase
MEACRPLSLRAQAIKRYRRVIAFSIEETGGARLARPPVKKGKRGRIKKGKSRNLLERLMEFEDAALRFMTDPLVPFGNNAAEQPVRMAKPRAKV